jgi:hypothetical protein
MKKVYKIILFLMFSTTLIYAQTEENADDICYMPVESSGTYCMDLGSCGGGVGCKKLYPLKNISNKTLSNVEVDYDESELGGSFSDSCGVENNNASAGTCESKSSIDMGPIGILDKTTHYTLSNSIAPGDDQNRVWAKNFVNGSCFYGENLYATYTKDGTRHRGKIKACKTISDGHDRPFTVRNPENTRNIEGNYAIIGNANQCALDTKSKSSLNGQCYNSYSNSRPSRFIDIDNDSSTKNSTKSTLNIPAGSKVLFAALYWQGVVHNSTNGNKDFMGDAGKYNGTKIKGKDGFSSGKQIDFKKAGTTYGADKVLFKVPGGKYVTVIADKQDHGNWARGFDYHNLGYSGFQDVTSLIDPDNPNGDYYVANIKSHQGVEKSHGNYAAWGLVVIYSNPNEKFRNITLFDGYATVDSHFNEDLVMSGFLTPRSKPIHSKLALFAMDGDNGSNHLYIENEAGEETDVQNQDNPNNSLFDATISNSILRETNTTSLRTDLKVLELTDVINPMETKATLKPRTSGDRYTPSFFIMSAELIQPRICYDYTYGQEGHFQTAPSIKPVRIEGHFSDTPIDVKLYFKNQENSDVTLSDLQINIDPIDSNTTYKQNSTYITKAASSTQTFVDDSGRDTAQNRDNNISIGDLGSLQYFYTYYSLNHSQRDINASINATLLYNLNIKVKNKTIAVGNQKISINKMPPCQSNSYYTPVPGRFNIVHDGETKNQNPYYYFNLPTQVVNRPGNYKIESMNPKKLNKAKKLANTTEVAIEMIDVAGFHYTTATCTDQNASVASNKRVWVKIDKDTKLSDISKTAIKNAGFFNKAIENAAFRISYNSDVNGTLLTLKQSANGNYKLRHFTASTGDKCANSNDDIVKYCGENGQGENQHGMNQKQLESCMECIYGIHTQVTCSRDNFAIRPEAFMFNIDDQNESSELSLTSNYSGKVAATAPVLDLAAGYNYHLRIKATTHIDNNASYGYSRLLDTDNDPKNITQYIWEPRSAITANACNDTSNKKIPINFHNGSADKNTTVDQVGEYRLHFLDTTWTAVDSDTQYMAHHTTAGNFRSGYDCVKNSAITQTANSIALNGCNISSTHTNPSTHVRYNDFNVTFHPYQFSMSNSVTLGMANGGVGITPPTTFKPFIYMSNISHDENMSVHLNTTVTAQGKDNVRLTNYTNGCFAKQINFTIQKTATTNPALVYSFRVHKKDENSTIIAGNEYTGHIPAGNPNANVMFQVPKEYFMIDKTTAVDSNGSAFILTNLNYNREVNVTTNPEDINFTTILADDNTTLFHADMINNKFSEGNVSVNQRVLHYYGRTIAPKISVTCNTKPCRTGMSATNNNNMKELISYVIYCNPATTLCSDAVNLPLGAGQVADIRWYENKNHDKLYTPGTDGKIGQINEVVHTGHVYEIVADRNITQPNYETESVIELDSSLALPYDAIMQMNSSPWLINDPKDENATANKFTIHFVGDGGWSGKYEDNTTTHTEAATKTTRRVMW